MVKFSADSDWIRVAYLTLAPLLGTCVASTLFAVALLASGQSSTITGTLAGQVVMEGFMHWRIQPWVRRLITRMLAILPAVFIIGVARRQQRYRSAHPQPGGAGLAASIRHVPAAAFHQFPEANGKVEERLVSVDCRLDQRDSDHSDGYLWLAGFAQSCMASDCRWMNSDVERTTLCMTKFS